MTDFTGSARRPTNRDQLKHGIPAPVATQRIFDAFSSQASFDAARPLMPQTTYVQRVYDLVLVAWCYYTKTTLDASPAPTETTPNHTGLVNLRPGAHEILRVVVGG